MELQILDPSKYDGWDELLLKSGDTQFFHSQGWARVLKGSYGYKPLYFSIFEKAKLVFLLPLMEIRSFLTGKRGVSLPFSDMCPPFIRHTEDSEQLLAPIIEYGKNAGWRCLELRGAELLLPRQAYSEAFQTHDLGLSLTDSELLSRFHPSNRHNIRKAEREGVYIQIETSLDSLKQFYRLNCITRRRHGLPSQPYAFFHNIHSHLLSQGLGIVVSAFHSNRCIASSIFLNFGKHCLFKFGASDIKFQRLRPNNLIMWDSIKWYRDRGFQTMNFGRTNIDDHGLLRFKRNWGVKEGPLRYHHHDLRKKTFSQRKRIAIFHQEIFRRMPIFILRLIGRIIYKHVG